MTPEIEQLCTSLDGLFECEPGFTSVRDAAAALRRAFAPASRTEASRALLAHAASAGDNIESWQTALNDFLQVRGTAPAVHGEARQ